MFLYRVYTEEGQLCCFDSKGTVRTFSVSKWPSPVQSARAGGRELCCAVAVG